MERCNMVLPNYLIVGAMKSGTSTLMQYLADHNDIFVVPKELHFFSKECNYNRGIEWYAKQFKDASSELAIGEKSPPYSYLPNVPERIHQHLPQVKLIWIFREPVARAYSNYWHYIKSGFEHLDFESAIYREEERMIAAKANPDRFYDSPYCWCLKGYRKRSVYIEQVRRYLECFPKDQMLFICFEHFIRDPHSTLKRVFEFLGVRMDLSITIQRANTTRLPRSEHLTRIFRKLFGNTMWYYRAQRFNSKHTKGYPPIKEETKLYLRDYFKEYNKQLGELIEQDLSIWDTL